MKLLDSKLVLCYNSKKFGKDPVATAAGLDGVPVFKFPGWRRKGVVKVKLTFALLWLSLTFLQEEVLEQYKSVGAELNVMPYCSQFIPLEVVNHPQYK